MLYVFCLNISNKIPRIKLPRNVIDHINKYKNKQMRQISKLGWSTLFKLLKNKFDFSDDVIFSKNGKPSFKSNKIHFSLSHSLNLIAIAISDTNVGIDIEAKIPDTFLDLLSKRILDNKQTKLFNKSKDKSSYLTKVWTQKEAMAKYNDNFILDNKKINNVDTLYIRDDKQNVYCLSIIN